jgi:hypothetical protein
MQEGKLVTPIPNRSQMKPGLYVIVRKPYEFSTRHTIKGVPVTKMVLCVDLLSPSGQIIKHVACQILEPA